MKWIFIFLYIIITWFILGIINIFKFIFYLDNKHFDYYGTYFLTIKDIKDWNNELLTPTIYYKSCNGLNIIEKLIYKCLK